MILILNTNTRQIDVWSNTFLPDRAKSHSHKNVTIFVSHKSRLACHITGIPLKNQALKAMVLVDNIHGMFQQIWGSTIEQMWRLDTWQENHWGLYWLCRDLSHQDCLLSNLNLQKSWKEIDSSELKTYEQMNGSLKWLLWWMQRSVIDGEYLAV